MKDTINAPRISEEELQHRFDEILDRVEQGEIFCITRNGTPMVMLVPISVYREIERLKRERMYAGLNAFREAGSPGITDASTTIDETLYGDNGAWKGECTNE